MNIELLHTFFSLSSCRILVLLWLVTGYCFAEGTKELRPSENNPGVLHISRKSQFTKFGQYGAAAEHQIRFRISHPDEQIYMGLNNQTEAGAFVADIPYRILSPSNNVFYKGVMQASGEGVISSYAEAAAGPAELGNAGGYDALVLHPVEVGDYILEFDLSGLGSRGEIQIHLFDITIADSSGVIPGRLYSKAWQLSVPEGKTFYGKVYPYTNDGVVYEVDLNRINPYTFVITFNSSGTGSTGDFAEDRKSRVGNFSFPEFPVFLNPPDENIFPVGKPAIIKGTGYRKPCPDDKYCLRFISGSSGLLEGYIDLNGNGVRDTDGGDYGFTENFSQGGEICIPWNSVNDTGMKVMPGNYKVQFSFSSGLIQFPIYDAEHNENGFKVKTIRPASADIPRLYWDDSEITTGSTLGEPLVNLTGCVNDSGCHRWKGRGDFDEKTQETINTWWYNTVKTGTFEINTSSPAAISLREDSLLRPAGIFCDIQEINLMIYKYSVHFDTIQNRYSWFHKQLLIAEDTPEVKLRNFDGGIIRLLVTSRDDVGCSLADSADINLKGVSTLEFHPLDCNDQPASVKIIMNESVDNFRVFLDSVEYSVNPISNLSPGTHSLRIISDSICTSDTTFYVTKHLPAISISTTPEYCDAGNGTAMINLPGKDFRIRWKDSDSFFRKGLVQGNYDFTIYRPEIPFCDLDSVITINKINSLLDIEILESPENASVYERIEFKLSRKGDDWLYYWNSGDGEHSADQIFWHFYKEPGNFDVSVKVEDGKGCVAELIKTVRTSEKNECRVSVPTAFSPNGDGHNDFLGVIGNPEAFQLYVFNRAGGVIFYSDDLMYKWDGKMQGSDLPVASYPFVLIYKCLNSENQYYSNKVTGDISLMR